MTTTRRTGGDAGGLKPWQTRSAEQPEKPKDAAQPAAAADDEQTTPAAAGFGNVDKAAAKALVGDVLEAAAEKKAATVSEQVSARNFSKALAGKDAVALKGGVLSIGGASFNVDAKLQAQLTLLPTTKATLAAVSAGLQSTQATLVSAPAGAGASHAVRWMLHATAARHEVVRLARTTTLDQLVGAMRPDEKKQLRVKDGPLTQMVRGGGVFVVDHLEQADPQILACLTALARGAKTFHHPVSNEAISVNANFRLVLLGDPAKKLPPQLPMACNVVEVSPYTADDHRQLLVEQHGLTTQLAAKLAALHQAFVDASSNGELDFGRRFPLAFGQLRTVAQRLEKAQKKGALDDAAVAEAVFDVYGGRLTAGAHIEAFAEVCAQQKLRQPPPTTTTTTKAKSDGYVVTQHAEQALRRAQTALDAGETVLLQGPGQSGASRLVEELAARRKQDVVTVVAHAGTDPQALLELPSFDETGRVVFKPGRITRALLEGKLLSIEHLDHMPVDRQNAFFRLRELTSISVVENGKLVEKKVDPRARIVLSATTGASSAKQRPDAVDRALATEVHLPAPSVEDAARLLPPGIAADVKDAVVELATSLWPPPLPVKLQRFLDLANAADLIAKTLPSSAKTSRMDAADARAADVARAVERAAHMLVELPPAAAQKLSAAAKHAAPDATPLWQRLSGLSDKEIQKRLSSTPYRLVPSLERHLDALFVAHALGRPVLAVGPAAAGKTVLGALFAALTDKQNVRVNFSASTEARDLTGGVGPVNDGGKTRFREVDGPALQAAALQATLTADEWNLSKEARMALKSMLDHRRVAIDAERDKDVELKSTFFYAAQNPTDARSGRAALEPTILDCMFVVEVDAKPVDEKVDIVRGHTTLPKAQVENIANFFSDLEVAKKKLKSSVAPITTTERDILKAAKAAQHFIERDGVKDPKAQQAIIARETFRVVADVLVDPKEKEVVWNGLIQKAFSDPSLKMPSPPTTFEKKVVTQNGKKIEVLQIGAAQVPVRLLSSGQRGAAADALVPTQRGLKDPIGPQLAVLESILLGIETNQPTALVGTTGTGKTMLMRWVAHQLNWPVHEQAFHEDMTKDDILGAPVLKKDGKVEFKHSPLDNAVLDGGIFIGDEYLTLSNDTRETTNPITEGSELQIPSRPPRTVKKSEWHESFRYFVTTNGGDIRKADFSMAEASRLRVLAVGELVEQTDLEAIAQRDFAHQSDGAKLAINDKLDVKAALKAAKAGTALSLANAYVALRKANDKELASDEVGVVAAIAQLPAAERLQIAASISRPTKLLAEALACPVVDGKLTSRAEVTQAVEVFCQLRALQQKSSVAVSPLTQRVFSSFLEILGSLRGRTSFEAAVMRAAELTLLSKMGRANEKKAADVVAAVVGAKGGEADARVPVIGKDSVVFGDTAMKKGKLPTWEPDNRRFPLTPARCHNLALLADAVELGRGRPISCSDDENGETVEVVRELGRLTGRPVTIVTLSKNVDIDALIEKLTLSKDPKALGSFEPELQQIGLAVLQGHMLVLRGCGNVPTTKLERLNSLGDGRQSITLPRTGDVIEAHPDFRMVLLKKPNSPFGYSPALENRLLEPMLTTRAEAGRAVDKRAAELAGVVRERTGISTDNALKLAAFHTYLNEVLKQGTFASGRAIGSFLNRDAEAVAQRMAWLTAKGAGAADDVETLHGLVMQVYGERFAAESDRALLDKLAQRAFGADGNQLDLRTDAVRTPNLVRFGDWVLQADPRGVREGVPLREDVLPPTDALEDVQQKVFAALQFDEVVQLHGDAFVGGAVTAGVARLTTSRVIEVDGNEELSEAYLFGGLVQNQQTGKFEMHEGLLQQAQEEGATLVLKNASRIPDDVLLPLAEMAATGMVSRVENGKTTTQPRAFRLVLQTNEGDPPLLADLATVATRVNCQNVSDKKSLTTIVGHVLVGVAGGQLVAETLVKLTAQCQKLVDGEALSGRQPLRYDSGRAVEAGRQIARLVKRDGVGLEDAVADVVQRLYLRPAAGLGCAEKIADLVEGVGETLAAPGVLEAELPPAIDDVEKPALALLLKDYAAHAPSFSASAGIALAEALRAQSVAGQLKQATALLTTASTSTLLPAAVRERCEKALKKPVDEAAVAALAGVIERLCPPPAVSVADAGLEFMRGARLWDVEHRRLILDEYNAFFASLSKTSTSAETSKALSAELTLIGERFDSADAVAKVSSARSSVATAFASYQRRSGERDEQLSGLFRKLLESWDFVATSPIFVKHAVLRQELDALSQVLSQIVDAHQRRGEPVADVNTLVQKVKQASAVLEGVRIAEQSTDLRRGLASSSKATETLIQSLRGELSTLRTLEAAEAEHKKLSSLLTATRGLGVQDLAGARIEIEEPTQKSDATLKAEAATKAEAQLSTELAELKTSLLQKAQAAQNAPALAGFFDNYDVAAAFSADGAAVNASGGKDRAVEVAMKGVDAEYEKQKKALVDKRAGEIFADDKKAQQAQATKELQGKIELRANAVAQRLSGHAKDMGFELSRLTTSLKLDAVDPQLAKDVAAAQAQLAQVQSEAQGWCASILSASAKLADATLAFFGFGASSKKTPPPPLDTSKVAKDVAAVVARVEKHILGQMKALPDFAKKGAHQSARDDLLEQLVTADTWGALSQKVARIGSAASAESDLELKRALTQITGRVGGGSGKLLLQIAALGESANTLSSTLANASGVSPATAAVLEPIVHAAEAFASQPIGDKTFKQPIKALQTAIRAVDGLGAGAHPLLLAVKSEMEALLSALGVTHGTVSVDGAGINAMLQGLADAVGAAKTTSSASGSSGSGSGSSSLDDAPAGASLTSELEAQLVKSFMPNAVEGRERVTELKLIELSVDDGLAKLKESAAKIDADDVRAKEKKSVARLGKKLVEGAQEQIAGLHKSQQQIAAALDVLEAGVAQQVLEQRAQQLGDVEKRLEDICSHGGGSWRTAMNDVGVTLQLLRKSTAALSSLSSAPTTLAPALQAVIDDARALTQEPARFDENAFAWARNALKAVRDGKDALMSAGAAAPAGQRGQLGALDDVEKAMANLDKHTGRLGAASAAQLLLATATRLSALAESLPAASAKSASALASSAQRRGDEKLRGTGGVAGEKTVSDLVEAFAELAAGLAKDKGGTDDHVAAAAALRDAIVVVSGAPGALDADLAVCADAIDAARALRGLKHTDSAASEIDKGFGALRAALLDQAIDGTRRRHHDNVSAWTDGVAGARGALRAASLAFVDYDPLTEKRTLQEVARELRDAVASASGVLTGPAAVLLAHDLKDLQTQIDASTTVKGEGDKLLRALDSFVRVADGVLEDVPDGDVRFAKMLAALDARIAAASKHAQKQKVLPQLDAAIADVGALMKVPSDQLAAALADVEAKHFKELAPAATTVPTSTSTSTSTVQVQSAVEKVLELQKKNGGGGGAFDVVGGGALGGAVFGGFESEGGAGRAGRGGGSGVVAVGVGAAGGAPDAPDEDLKDAKDVRGTGAGGRGAAADKDGVVDEVKRGALADTAATSRSDTVNVIELSTDGMKDVKKAIEEEIAAEKARLLAEDPRGTAALNDYQQFVLDNDELVEEMALALRQVPNTELVVVVDQSGSTAHQAGDSRIIDQERAALALFMAAVQRSESNCAVVGFGSDGISRSRGAHLGGVATFVHKPMSTKLDDDTANVAFNAAAHCGGGTDFIGPLSVAAGQFSSKANNKLIVFLTDGELNDAGNVRRYIDGLRGQDAAAGRPPTGVAFMGFGDAAHIEHVAGKQNSAYVRGYKDAATKAADLLQRTLVHNQSGLGGKQESSAGGIGVSTSQQALSAAPGKGLGEAAASLDKPFVAGDDPAVVYGTEGDRRALANLADRATYDRALKDVERTQQKSTSSPQFKKALQLVREMNARHQRDGTHAALVSGISSTLPKTGGAQWARKQTTGTALDEGELPMYLMGLEQGVPVTKIFKRRKATEEGKATVVLSLDESTSMSPEKQRAALEGMFAYADALKAIDEKIEIAVLGFGHNVRLHAGFEQPWGDELKAQILMQVQNADQASDDERAGAEAVALLKMAGADVGQVVCFSDGQGMPGMKQVMRAAEQEGFGFLTVGVGPESKSVMRFGDNGLYARNLNALALHLPSSAVKMWERAGRLVAG